MSGMASDWSIIRSSDQGISSTFPQMFLTYPTIPSATEPVTAIIARTDPNEQESVVLLPELEAIHPA